MGGVHTLNLTMTKSVHENFMIHQSKAKNYTLCVVVYFFILPSVARKTSVFFRKLDHNLFEEDIFLYF